MQENIVTALFDNSSKIAQMSQLIKMLYIMFLENFNKKCIRYVGKSKQNL